MKTTTITKYAVILLLMLSGTLSLCAADNRSERIFVATDRDAYLAGENIWLSLYCFESGGVLSSFSSVAYVEIQSTEGTGIFAKLALREGRGGGRIELPPSLPTGNYQLTAYTKQMLNEEKAAFFKKTISVYNTLTTARVAGNVVVSDERPAETSREKPALNSSFLDVKIYGGHNVIPAKSRIPVSFTNTGDTPVSMHISVLREDNVPAPANISLASFVTDIIQQGDLPVSNLKVVPDFEGEIIEVSVKSAKGENLSDKVMWFSAAGGVSDIYTTLIDSTGKAVFFTNSFFGKREVVLDVPEADTTAQLNFTIKDPFLKIRPETLPELKIYRGLNERLRTRSIEMQLWRRFFADSLYEKKRVMYDPLLPENHTEYLLDNYTRFPVMREVISEYVPELRFRKVEGKTMLQMILSDRLSNVSISRDNTLVLLDGIPVFDHNKIFNYDPLRVKSLKVYEREFFIGYLSFSGIASFSTYRGDYPGLSFQGNVRIMDYRGLEHPSRFTGTEVRGGTGVPDTRSLIYWEPVFEINGGENSEIFLQTPSYSGTFTLRIEGISAKGEPFAVYKEFTVK
jgi:hypothetical protein